jgi:4a-hydroxytetrahydrobiopterin dehydratase
MGRDEKLSEDDGQARLSGVPGWDLRDGVLRRQFTFSGFPDALAFVVRIGFTAEAADHHPGIVLDYKRVTLTFVTHSAGGLTVKDFTGAAAASATAAAMSGS